MPKQKKDIALHLRYETKRTDLPDDVIRTMAEAYAEIVGLERRIEDIKNGFEGCCNACEPVGVMNKKLQDELISQSYKLGGWQPITTAPKDGEIVDLWVTYCCFGRERSQRLVDCYWRDNCWRHGSYDIGDDGVTPTHWMRIENPIKAPERG
jgi:hypothetical protein